MRRKMFLGLLLLVGALTFSVKAEAQVVIGTGSTVEQTFYGARANKTKGENPCKGRAVRICGTVKLYVQNVTNHGSVDVISCVREVYDADGEFIDSSYREYEVPVEVEFPQFLVNEAAMEGLESLVSVAGMGGGSVSFGGN